MILEREVIKDYLCANLEGIKIPEDISMDDLTEAFCRFTEDDFYEWLKDNFKVFFTRGMPDWDWIRERIKDIKTE